jgi:hypothetical protein
MGNSIDASTAQIAIDMVIMDAIEKGQTNPSDFVRYMNTTIFDNAVKRYLVLIEEMKISLKESI